MGKKKTDTILDEISQKKRAIRREIITLGVEEFNKRYTDKKVSVNFETPIYARRPDRIHFSGMPKGKGGQTEQLGTMMNLLGMGDGMFDGMGNTNAEVKQQTLLLKTTKQNEEIIEKIRELELQILELEHQLETEGDNK